MYAKDIAIHGRHFPVRLKTDKKHRVSARCGKSGENRLTSGLDAYVRLIFPAP